uniref:Uncharacterized protein n=1 Tax=Anguilla anguilla TaxID=7936 RepID=A0A0E9REG5_ANGAN
MGIWFCDKLYTRVSVNISTTGYIGNV